MTVMGTDSVTGSPLFAERLPEHAPEQARASVAVLGLGYVGLPTSIGLAEHQVARKGAGFIAQSVRADGSWPVDTASGSY